MQREKRTKIVATLGPVSDSEPIIKKLITAGVNVFRFNMKHATHEWHHERIDRVQKVADAMHKHIGILIDLQGPEIRIETREHQDITVLPNEPTEIVTSFTSSPVGLCVPHDVFCKVLKPKDIILIDDGRIELKVLESYPNRVVVQSDEKVVISHRKGVNLPGKKIDMPSLIDDDLKKLDMAGKAKVDFVALSFSRTKKDIDILRKEMEKRKMYSKIIAKIESQEAIDNIDELIDHADGVMVARGDLGIEVPIEQLAYLQKIIVQKCRVMHKPVIVATEMLQSMVENSRPTRAEATDVANAVLGGADAVMLSGETAFGKFPIKAVKAMSKIAKFSEDKTELLDIDLLNPTNNAELIVHAASAMIDSPHHPNIDSIVVFTETGYTAQIVSAFRPNMPIIAITRDEQVVEFLSLSYGVYAFRQNFPRGVFHLPKIIIQQLKKRNILHKNEQILVIHGQHWQRSGETNALAILRVE